ncbi:MAG TPA: hypothetical protein VFD46_14220 [Chryseolinea sp.]|nr:hypothetical protein [Chryseolinea sp.]
MTEQTKEVTEIENYAKWLEDTFNKLFQESTTNPGETNPSWIELSKMILLQKAELKGETISEEQPKAKGIAAVGIQSGIYSVERTDKPGTYRVPTYKEHADGSMEYAGHCNFHLFHEDQGIQERYFYPAFLEQLLRIHKETVNG